MTDFDKRVVAVYVGGRPLGAAASGDAAQMPNRCDEPSGVPAVEGFRVERVGIRQRQLALPDDAGPDRRRRPRSSR